MKLKRLLFLLLFLALPSFAYEQQWFSGYQEMWDKVSFLCESQCFVLLWNTSTSEFLSIAGSVQGSWVFGYGFLVGQQIYPGEIVQVNWSLPLDKQFRYADVQNFSQLPSSTQVVLILQWSLQSNGLTLQQSYMDFGTKISQGWKSFWSMEGMTPYSINLRYGVKIWSASIVKYGYRLFILIGVLILLFVKWWKERKGRMLFFLWCRIFLIIGIRNLFTYTSIVHQWLQDFTFASSDTRTFFGLWDYLVFTDKVRKTLHLDDKHPQKCTMYAESEPDWPYRIHWSFVYMEPCNLIQDAQKADYLLFYQKPAPAAFTGKKVLLQYHGNVLLDNNQ